MRIDGHDVLRRRIGAALKGRVCEERKLGFITKGSSKCLNGRNVVVKMGWNFRPVSIMVYIHSHVVLVLKAVN